MYLCGLRISFRSGEAALLPRSISCPGHLFTPHKYINNCRCLGRATGKNSMFTHKRLLLYTGSKKTQTSGRKHKLTGAVLKVSRKNRYPVSMFIFGVVLIVFMAAEAAEIPFGVSTVEVRMAGSVDIDDITVDRLSDGSPGYFERWQEGQRRNIVISGIDYELTFWNVGKLGGTTGRL